MTQDDYFVIAILEMCTDPELSKRFREVKADELTWEKLKDVAEVYERATVSDNRAMLVNSNKKNWKKNQNAQTTNTKQCYRCNRKGHAARKCRTDKEKLYCMYPKLTRKKERSPGTTATKNLVTCIKQDR